MLRFLLTALLPFLGTSGSCGPIENDIDYIGNDLESDRKITQSMEECCTLCASIAACKAVTWNVASDKNCNPKTSAAGHRTSAGHQSARLSPSPTVDIPQDWLDRATVGNLVYSHLPVAGPMPNFGNGYMATQLNSQNLYIAGVFSGDLPPPFGSDTGSGVTARAGLPYIFMGLQDTTKTALALDFERAWIEELGTMSGLPYRQRVYAHRSNMHLLVSELALNNTRGEQRVSVTLSAHTTGGPSKMSWNKVLAPGGVQCYQGVTNVAEASLPPVKVAACMDADGKQFEVGPGIAASSTLFASIWTSLEVADPLAAAKEEWSDVNASLASESLSPKHVAAQEQLWGSRIEFEGDVNTATTVNSSMYGILISVREDLNYSTSPGGLPTSGYNGHVFWDTEQFMWPNLLAMHPNIAKAAMQYRFDRMGTAAQNAREIVGCVGLKYPWESGVTGYEACPYSAKQNSVREIHISGDVALSMWQTWQGTRDKDWLRHVGWPVLKGVSQFYASRATKTSDGGFTILDAGGPDERYSHSDDESYTLAVASLSLRHAIKAAQLLGEEFGIGANWSAISEGLLARIPRDDQRGIIREFKNSTARMHPNGLGVVMLRYPLNISTLSDATHLADLDFYSTMWAGGNAMYWWAFTTGYAEVGSPKVADGYLAKTTAKNVYGPFKIWSENQGGGGCPNFLSGAGGYLQSIWAGYCGLRFADDSLHILAPRVPPGGAKAMVLRNVAYAGAMLEIRVAADRSATVNLSTPGPMPLLLAVDGKDGVPLTAKKISIPAGSRVRIFVTSAVDNAIFL